MNDDIKSLPNGDFYVVPAKKPSAPPPKPKKGPIRSRPRKS